MFGQEGGRRTAATVAIRESPPCGRCERTTNRGSPDSVKVDSVVICEYFQQKHTVGSLGQDTFAKEFPNLRLTPSDLGGNVSFSCFDSLRPFE